MPFIEVFFMLLKHIKMSLFCVFFFFAVFLETKNVGTWKTFESRSYIFKPFFLNKVARLLGTTYIL